MKLSLALTMLSIFAAASAQNCLSKNIRCDDQKNTPGSCCEDLECAYDEYKRVDFKLCLPPKPLEPPARGKPKRKA